MTSSPMKEFSRVQITALFGRLVKALHRAAVKQDEQSVHDMRVSIRRFNQCLTVFGQYVPERATKKVRKQLRRVMRLSSKIRDLDIALSFLKKQRFPAGDLTDRRERARLELAEVLGAGNWGSSLDWSIDETDMAR